jgi:hypothetical protein
MFFFSFSFHFFRSYLTNLLILKHNGIMFYTSYTAMKPRRLDKTSSTLTVQNRFSSKLPHRTNKNIHARTRITVFQLHVLSKKVGDEFTRALSMKQKERIAYVTHHGALGVALLGTGYV